MKEFSQSYQDTSEILRGKSQDCSNSRHQYQFATTIFKMRVGCSKKLCFIFIFSLVHILVDKVNTEGSSGNVEIKP